MCVFSDRTNSETMKCCSLQIFPHLQAGVEAPSFLLLLFRRGIQPHKAIIPEDDGCTTWQVVKMCFLPLDQRRRKLYQHSLTQLIVRGSRSKL